MQTFTLLSKPQQTSALTALNKTCAVSWEVKSDKLYKLFTFNNFNDAFAFMTEIASIAESIDHHPDWCNSYNKVEISLTTHQSKGLTQLDFLLATKIETLQNNRQ